MSVKSIGYTSVSTIANDYTFPNIKLSSTNQILQISENTSLEDLGAAIAVVQAEATALETLVFSFEDDIIALSDEISTLNNNIDTQADELNDIKNQLSTINALLSITQTNIAVGVSINSRDTLEGSIFQPNLDNQFGVYESIGDSGVLSYSTPGSGVDPYILAFNINLSWAQSQAPSAETDYLKNGGKMLVQLVNSQGTVVYQSKQGMFNFETTNEANVSFSSSDVILLPRGTQIFTGSYYVCTQTETPTSTGQPTIFAQTSWLDASFYLEDNKAVQGFTYQFEAILFSL